MWCNRDRDFGSHPSAMLRWMVAKGPNRIARPVPRLRSRLRPESRATSFRRFESDAQLGPKLVAVASEFIETDSPDTFDWPESAAAAFVFQVSSEIATSREDALA